MARCIGKALFLTVYCLILFKKAIEASWRVMILKSRLGGKENQHQNISKGLGTEHYPEISWHYNITP